jgi:hypothetical protein
MPLPLIPIIAALSAGGTLVPHAAGGLIVTSASGYVAGTFLSTSAVAALFAGGVSILGAGAAAVTGVAASAIGSAGIFGTTVGATGLTGFLMSAGLISSTPIWVPITLGGAAAGASYGAFRLYRLRSKIKNTPAGQEAQFTDTEAKVVERMLRWSGKSPEGAT